MKVVRKISTIALSVLLSACSVPFSGNSAADDGLKVAQELHEMPMEGFSFSAIEEPDLGFSYNNPNSGFVATPASREFTGTECASVVEWVEAHLTEVKIALQYSSGATGQELFACLTAVHGLLKNSSPGLTFTGLFEGRFVYVVYEGATNGELGIWVSGADSSDEVEYDAGNSDNAADVQTLLGAIASYRADRKIASFTETEFADFWQEYQSLSGTPAKLSWAADSDGFVRKVKVENLSGLLPFNLWIDPVNKELLGSDPGAPYLFVLGEESGPKSFGFGW